MSHSNNLDLLEVYRKDLAPYRAKLSNKQAIALMEQYRAGDLEAREQLILSLVNLGPYYITRFRKLDPSEVVSTVNIAAIEIVDTMKDKWDTSQAPFKAYAAQAIRWALQAAHHDSQSVVKTRATTKMGKGTRFSPPRDIELSTPLHECEGGDSLTYGDILPDFSAKNPEQLLATQEGRDVLMDIFARVLTPRVNETMQVLYGLRDGEPQTPTEAAKHLKIARSTVNNMQARAIDTLRKIPGLLALLKYLVTDDKAYGKGPIPAPSGLQLATPTKRNRRSLSDATVRQIRKLHADGLTNRAIGRQLQVHDRIVSAIVTGQRYKDVR
jgi:RNA polymerase sigma factor (sigma-70 family)